MSANWLQYKALTELKVKMTEMRYPRLGGMEYDARKKTAIQQTTNSFFIPEE